MTLPEMLVFMVIICVGCISSAYLGKKIGCFGFIIGFPAAIPALIGYAATAVGIVSGVMAATKKTKSVATGLGGSGGGSGSVSPPTIPKIEIPQTESLPPAFNVVGASNTSQLADAIGGQSQQPIQTYVVSSDVTTSQEMERNIVTGASI